MLTRAWDARPSLLVVDLETRRPARRVLEWRARRMAARLAPRGRPGERLPQVLLHLPEAVGPSPGWPAGARVIRTDERLSPSRLRDIHEGAFARSFEVAHGSIGKVFPDVCGVGLGELNLMMIQKHLASFSIIASTLGDLLEGGHIGASYILSADVGFARALERQVARRVEAVSTWPPRRLLEREHWARSAWCALRRGHPLKAEQAARDAMAARLREHRLGGARPPGLLVSQAVPGAHTFAAGRRGLAPGRGGAVGPL